MISGDPSYLCKLVFLAIASCIHNACRLRISSWIGDLVVSALYRCHSHVTAGGDPILGEDVHGFNRWEPPDVVIVFAKLTERDAEQ